MTSWYHFLPATSPKALDFAVKLFENSVEIGGGAMRDICEAAADANNDMLVDSSDAVFLISYRFFGGPEPSPPFPECGVGGDLDTELGCATPPAYCQ